LIEVVRLTEPGGQEKYEDKKGNIDFLIVDDIHTVSPLKILINHSRNIKK